MLDMPFQVSIHVVINVVFYWSVFIDIDNKLKENSEKPPG